MRPNCREHGKSLELLSLKGRMEKGIPDPEERKEVEERIRVLEEELGLD